MFLFSNLVTGFICMYLQTTSLGTAGWQRVLLAESSGRSCPQSSTATTGVLYIETWRYCTLFQMCECMSNCNWHCERTVADLQLWLHLHFKQTAAQLLHIATALKECTGLNGGSKKTIFEAIHCSVCLVFEGHNCIVVGLYGCSIALWPVPVWHEQFYFI